MNGVGVYWSTDHMFGVPSRIVLKYALREPELEKRPRIAQSQSEKREKEWDSDSMVLWMVFNRHFNDLLNLFYAEWYPG